MSRDRSTGVLMLGWEFPPYISGGLGTACHGLIHALKVDFWDIDEMAIIRKRTKTQQVGPMALKENSTVLCHPAAGRQFDLYLLRSKRLSSLEMPSSPGLSGACRTERELLAAKERTE